MALVARGRASRAGTAYALTNAVVIATYTLIDGAGVRLSGAPVAYAMWLFLLNALPLVGWALVARGPALRRYARANLRPGLLGGLGNLGSYGLALWAMTGAPVAVVAALRETSILFAMAIAALVPRRAHHPRPPRRRRPDRARRRQPAAGVIGLARRAARLYNHGNLPTRGESVPLPPPRAAGPTLQGRSCRSAPTSARS